MGNCIMNSQYCHLVHFLFTAIFHTNMDFIKAGITSIVKLTQRNHRSLPIASLTFYSDSYMDGLEQRTFQHKSVDTHTCHVKQLGNKTVSWTQVRHVHILTVDRAVFIADQRFVALKQPDKFWTLQIKYVQARDAGSYECQVSTEPKISAKVHLQVVVPRTEILGDPDRYVKAGSIVVLRCLVRGALEAPTFIIWYHSSEQLTSESARHQMQIEKNLPETEGDTGNTIGSLVIEKAKKRDSGNYTCSPSKCTSVTVTLNILNGESSAAAITSSGSVITAYANILGILLLPLFLPCIVLHHT